MLTDLHLIFIAKLKRPGCDSYALIKTPFWFAFTVCYVAQAGCPGLAQDHPLLKEAPGYSYFHQLETYDYLRDSSITKGWSDWLKRRPVNRHFLSVGGDTRQILERFRYDTWSQINGLFEQLVTLDHLVITAVADETSLSSPIAQMSTQMAQRSMEKFWGTFFVVRAAAARMSARSSITLTSSIAIFNPPRTGRASVMNAASGAVAVLGRSLAAELAPIRVNVICPGVVSTGVWSETRRSELEKWDQEMLPVKHLGQPDELAHAFLFLMTNPYVTGSILTVDGGLMLT